MLEPNRRTYPPNPRAQATVLHATLVEVKKKIACLERKELDLIEALLDLRDGGHLPHEQCCSLILDAFKEAYW